MRTVFAHLSGCERSVIEAALDAKYKRQAAAPWLHERDGDPVLYIEIRELEDLGSEPEEAEELKRALGSNQILTVVADVSGRHPGDSEVAAFLEYLLGQFVGVAADGYTMHLWTLEEIRDRRKVDGHPFFDYKGWYEAP